MSKEKEIKDYGLNEPQKLFCKLYTSKEFFGNGVQSYCEAHNIDPTDWKKYNSAKTSAFDYLTNPNILSYINDLLDDAGLNDSFVDKQLLFTMTQNADLNAKMKAVAEYNKLKSRITEKSEIKHTGDFDITFDIK